MVEQGREEEGREGRGRDRRRSKGIAQHDERDDRGARRDGGRKGGRGLRIRGQGRCASVKDE